MRIRRRGFENFVIAALNRCSITFAGRMKIIVGIIAAVREQRVILSSNKHEHV